MIWKKKVAIFFSVAIIFDLHKTSEADQSLFFPFGLDEGDEFLPANDDGSTDELPISVAFPFFDHEYTSLFVNNNGVISFLGRFSRFTPDPFPLANNRSLLTPFWADVNTILGGAVSYRQVLRFVQNDSIFLGADEIIRASFVGMRGFVSSWMYIATWDRIAFFGSSTSNTSLRNSFQAVMVTDGRYSFAIFNYGDINWTTGTSHGGNASTGLGGTPAQVGFDAGDGVTFYSVPGSQTAAVVDIETTSNIDVPGRWVFRTDNSNIEGLECTTSGAISLFPLVGSMLGGTQVLISGPCFNSTNLIVCDFDGFQTSGRLLSDKIALCVSPTIYTVGRIPLRVSLDDGVTFDFTDTFTIMRCPPLPAPANGNAIVTTYMERGVARFVCDADFEMSHVVNLTCQSDGTWSDGDIPTCISEASGQTMTMTSFETSQQLTPNRENVPISGTPLGPVLSTPVIIGISVGSVILIVFYRA